MIAKSTTQSAYHLVVIGTFVSICAFVVCGWMFSEYVVDVIEWKVKSRIKWFNKYSLVKMMLIPFEQALGFDFIKLQSYLVAFIWSDNI